MGNIKYYVKRMKRACAALRRRGADIKNIPMKLFIGMG